MPSQYEAGMRHARYYAEILHQAEAAYMEGGPHLDEGLDRFDLESPNITGAQDWLAKNVESNEDATALCAVHSLSPGMAGLPFNCAHGTSTVSPCAFCEQEG